MDNKQDWLNWIDDQIKDMYNEDSFLFDLNNRVFKTDEDDRYVAIYLLKKLKSLLETK